MQEESIGNQSGAPGMPGIEDQSPLPACCGTGCTVCVLDYPEFHSSHESDVQALLKAVEDGQKQAEQLIARMDGETEQS